MRSPLLLSVAVLATGVAFAATGAWAQPGTTSSSDASTFNTSGPGQSNETNPGGRPLSGYGTPPARARLNPDDGAAGRRAGVGTSRSVDPSSFNTAAPGQANSSSLTHTPVPQRPLTPAQAKSAANPGNGAQPYAPATTATQTGSTYNTGGPAVANQANPAGGAPGR